ncbi:hypothetical protein [Flavobacterium gilvum]|uniref:Lipoprotein n=1 Tax=Flavobacterium gilvum TaxID=1492737 RepID=A0AAC9I2S8_9FLAO|nr:hypothetical protein [Flavobacterium gilvum]AOW08460.1 hypothetical protein EM308_02500 [Flavobacterium gilvum]KFC58512.1 hypothetical protein FEM08_27250 [Flavobacterium gilvum]
MKKIILLGTILCFFISCQQKEQPKISFYYWKTIFRLSPKEKNTLTTNQVKRIYIRYFDIDLSPTSQKPFPRTPIRFEETTSGLEIVPVVYIKNKVMLDKKLNVLDLAQKTNNFIQQINNKNNISINEIQIDCDWTLESKDNYIRFIEAIKKVSDKKLSATIRLHQIKYFKKTNIPNVDRGVLMYYNMGKIATDSLNSIYVYNIANRYVASLKNYPLPLDIALPIYSWGIHIREGKIIGLRSKINIYNLRKNSNFVPTKPNWFTVKNSSFNNGIFYKKNDQIKTENISKTDLLEMANTIDENCSQNPKEIIFYDLDDFNLNNYEEGIFKEIIDCF